MVKALKLNSVNLKIKSMKKSKRKKQETSKLKNRQDKQRKSQNDSSAKETNSEENLLSLLDPQEKIRNYYRKERENKMEMEKKKIEKEQIYRARSQRKRKKKRFSKVKNINEKVFKVFEIECNTKNDEFTYDENFNIFDESNIPNFSINESEMENNNGNEDEKYRVENGGRELSKNEKEKNNNIFEKKEPNNMIITNKSTKGESKEKMFGN